MATPGKARRISGLVLHVLIGGLLVLAGAMKLAGMVPEEEKSKMSAGISANLLLIGAGELVTGILLIVPVTSSLGVLLTSGFWGGVICLQMAEGKNYIPFAIMLLVTWVAAFLRDPRVFYSFPTRGTHAESPTA